MRVTVSCTSDIFIYLLSADDFQNTILTEGEFFTKEDGLRYLRLLDIDAHPKIGDMIIKANGIFPDPELGKYHNNLFMNIFKCIILFELQSDELALNVANNYWRDIYGVMLPETRKSWAPLMLKLINQGLMTVPVDQFLEPSD